MKVNHFKRKSLSLERGADFFDLVEQTRGLEMFFLSAGVRYDGSITLKL